MDTESPKNATSDLGSTLESEPKEYQDEVEQPQSVNDDPTIEEDKEKNEKVPEADLSDDEKDRNIELFNYLHVDADYWQRRKEVDGRRKERDKQRRQHSRYMLNLDDRLNYLEE